MGKISLFGPTLLALLDFAYNGRVILYKLDQYFEVKILCSYQQGTPGHRASRMRPSLRHTDYEIDTRSWGDSGYRLNYTAVLESALEGRSQLKPRTPWLAPDYDLVQLSCISRISWSLPCENGCVLHLISATGGCQDRKPRESIEEWHVMKIGYCEERIESKFYWQNIALKQWNRICKLKTWERSIGTRRTMEKREGQRRPDVVVDLIVRKEIRG